MELTSKDKRIAALAFNKVFANLDLTDLNVFTRLKSFLLMLNDHSGDIDYLVDEETLKHIQNLSELERLVAELRKDNVYLSKASALRVVLGAIHETYKTKFNSIATGATYVYYQTEDIVLDAQLYGYILQFPIVKRDDVATYELIANIYDNLSNTNIKVSIITQEVSSRLRSTLYFNDITKSAFSTDNLSSVMVYYGRHITSIKPISPTVEIKYTTYVRVIESRPVIRDSMPTMIEEYVLFQESEDHELLLGASAKLELGAKIGGDTDIIQYYLIPGMLTEYISGFDEAINFIAWQQHALNYELLVMTIESLIDTTLQMGIDDDQLHSRLTDYQVIANTQSLRSILSIIKDVPLYEDFTFSLNHTDRLAVTYERALVIIPHEQSIQKVSNKGLSYQSDGVGTTVNFLSHSSKYYLPKGKQNLIANNDRTYVQEILIHDDSAIRMYIIAEMTRETPLESGKPILQQGVNPSAASTQPQFIVLRGWEGPSVPTENDRYLIKYETHPLAQLSLNYYKTTCSINFKKLVICFKNSFSTPTDIQVTGSVQVSAMSSHQSVQITNPRPANITLKDGSQYHAITCELNLVCTKTFSENITYGVTGSNIPSAESGMFLYSNRRTDVVKQSKSIAINDGVINLNYAYGTYYTTTALLGEATRYTFYVISELTVSGNADEVLRRSVVNLAANNNISKREYMSKCFIKISNLRVSCKRAKAVGISDVVDAYDSRITTVSGMLFQITVEMAIFESRLDRVEDQIAEINKWIEDQIKNQPTWESIIFNAVINALIGIAVEALLPKVGQLLLQVGKFTFKYLSRAAISVARTFVAIGRKVPMMAKSVIPDSFISSAHQLRVLIRGWSIKTNKTRDLDNAFTIAFAHAKTEAYYNIPIHVRNLSQELRFAETANAFSKFKYLHLNSAYDGSDVIHSYLEINHHGLTKVGKLPILHQPTTKLLNSKLGIALSKKNLAPAHAYVVGTEVRQLSATKLGVTRYVSGVAEGLESNAIKGVTIGSMKFEYEMIAGNNIQCAQLKPLAQSDFTPSQIISLYTKYFPKGKHIDIDSKYIALASKFATVQSNNLKTQVYTLPQSQRLSSIHEFLKQPRSYPYNLLTNNCQTYAQSITQYLKEGEVVHSLNSYADAIGGLYLTKLRHDLESFV